MWAKNDKFGLVRMDSEFVSIKPRRNTSELYIKNGYKGRQVIMTKKDFVPSEKRMIDRRFET